MDQPAGLVAVGHAATIGAVSALFKSYDLTSTRCPCVDELSRLNNKFSNDHMNSLWCPLSDRESVLSVGGQQEAPSPGFQIGGKWGGYEVWLKKLTNALQTSNVPKETPGQSDKTGGSGVYPGGLNANTYFGLLTSNPIFDTVPN